ncbi:MULTISPECIES: hypothetical protein [unclassified Frankia]|uniref:hypothetical protein n=1 Tax=unclassified Frankia TaxID=2632575 RepID=UPI0018E99B88|nr:MULTISPECIES: hypothetical protein [unclassified Frankia]
MTTRFQPSGTANVTVRSGSLTRRQPAGSTGGAAAGPDRVADANKVGTADAAESESVGVSKTGVRETAGVAEAVDIEGASAP